MLVQNKVGIGWAKYGTPEAALGTPKIWLAVMLPLSHHQDVGLRWAQQQFGTSI